MKLTDFSRQIISGVKVVALRSEYGNSRFEAHNVIRLSKLAESFERCFFQSVQTATGSCRSNPFVVVEVVGGIGRATIS